MIAVVVLVTIASVAGLRRLSFDSNVLSLLPRDGRAIAAFRTFLDRFGSLDQLYVVFTAAPGHEIPEYRDEVDAWVEALRGAPEIERVDAGVTDRSRDFGWLGDRQLLLLTGSSLDDALARLTPEGVAHAVAARRELLSVPSADVAALVRQDPAGLLDLLRSSAAGMESGLGLGAGQDGYVTADHKSRLVMARPNRPPYDSAFSHALDQRLTAMRLARASAFSADQRGEDEPLPPLTVEFAGGHRIAVETEAVVKRESISNSVESLALILPLLFLVFRSLWLVAVGSLPSALSLVVVLGGLGFAGVELSAAATGAAAMLFGLGVDGVVLLYVAQQLAIANGEGTGTAAIEGPSTSMLLGMFTTAATFYGLTFVDFPSLRQLGLLIGHSMVVCGVLTLVMVPALLPRRRPTRRRPALRMPGLAAWTIRRRRAILVAAALLTIGLGIAAFRLRIDPTLDRLRSTTDSARLEERIGPAFGLPRDVYVVLSEGGDLERLLQDNESLSARLRGIPGLAFQPPSRLLPSQSAQAKVRARIGAAALDSRALAASFEQARQAGGFAAGAFDPFLARLPALIHPPPLSFDDFTAHRLDDVIGRFVVREGSRWLLATYVFPKDVAQARLVQSAVDTADQNGSTQTLTGLPVVNAELARRFFPDFVKGLVIGTLLVVALVVVTFRSARLSAFALLPTVVGLIWTAGLLAIAGLELDLFAIFAVVTFVGVGVDYGIHLVHRYAERRNATQATAELAPVILVAGAITMLGYATLVTSSYAPLRSIGVVSTVSVIALASASVFLLPALLARSEEG